jgi:hypothetical protein
MEQGGVSSEQCADVWCVHCQGLRQNLRLLQPGLEGLRSVLACTQQGKVWVDNRVVLPVCCLLICGESLMHALPQLLQRPPVPRQDLDSRTQLGLSVHPCTCCSSPACVAPAKGVDALPSDSFELAWIAWPSD